MIFQWYDIPLKRLQKPLKPVVGQLPIRSRSDWSGKVIHGSDLPILQLRLSVLIPEEATAARNFKNALQEAVQPALDPSKGDFVQRDEDEVLILTDYGESVWGKDWRWTRLRAVEQAVRG
jgi:hypothetical protein